ncbi:MAG: photosystem reaction center subunit [Sphingomonas bacterium]|uniref:PRC-barrel domain-containing protein n=1 Tax=Sphingomonas bacterium TaxID=1895847 RepID=UPI00261F1D0F|nr:PRC-barrel domain-containing protein [Sphingomonas bacterium]MDB5695088.1 photosystem reaction center subunit [Sphingomonas bacterium]
MSTTTATDMPTLLLVQANATHSPRVETRDGSSVGSVYSYMIHKGSGRATHAVLSLGGFLGMGKSFYPVPFALLQFDPVRDLYVVTVDATLLKGGPSWANSAPHFDQGYADRVANYYGAPIEDLTR